MIGFHDLKYFKAVAEAGTLRKAAQDLHVSQPALSHSLHRLEKELGAILFERTKKGVKLTPSGDQLLVRADQLLSDWEAMSRSISANDQQVKGRCRLGVHPAVARYSLSKFIPNLMKTYSDLEITLLHDLSRNITQAIVDSTIDIGIVVNPVSHPDLIITELCTDEVGLWKKKGASIQEEVLIYDPGLAQTQWILGKLEKKKASFRRHIESSDLMVIFELVSSGAGVAILPARVALSRGDGGLVPYSSDMPTFQDRVCLVYKSIFSKTKIGKVVIDAIKKAKI